MSAHDVPPPEPTRPVESLARRCPVCGALVAAAALECLACGEMLETAVRTPAEIAKLRQDRARVAMIGFGVFFAVVGGAAMVEPWAAIALAVIFGPAVCATLIKMTASAEPGREPTFEALHWFFWRWLAWTFALVVLAPAALLIMIVISCSAIFGLDFH